jgi:hypothetical protein
MILRIAWVEAEGSIHEAGETADFFINTFFINTEVNNVRH